MALARGGSGTVDVIEIDAASHGGVDDARDLRERASYGPAQSRYKIYIIDEAHMVTPQGFNALLKIVEEPPEHVKFVFATTEPEKVIGTIRSRTHHYPFRLVPPQRLQDYMEQLCASEGVTVAPGVLSFVVRAGGGSVRDSLSVLDQLIAGSGDDGLTYESAAALLGFTDGELLDAIVDAFAAGDGAGVFTQIDRVIETGLDPRRFVEDLLERLRDLIVVAAVPDGASLGAARPPRGPDRADAPAGCGVWPRHAVAGRRHRQRRPDGDDRRHRPASPARAHLRARLLPGASGESGYAARLDRIERRLEVGGVPTGGAGRTLQPRSAPGRGQRRTHHRGRTPGLLPALRHRPPLRTSQHQTRPPPAVVSPAAAARAAAREASGPTPDRAGGRARPATPVASATPAAQAPAAQAPAARAPAAPESASPTAPSPSPAPSAEAEKPTPAGGIDTAAIRRAWPDVLSWLSRNKRVTWTLVSDHAHVLSYDGRRLELGIAPTPLLMRFRQGPHAELIRQALIDVLGVDARVEGVPNPEGGPAAGSTPLRGGGAVATRHVDTAPGAARGGSAGAQADEPAEAPTAPTAPAPAARDSQPGAAGAPSAAAGSAPGSQRGLGQRPLGAGQHAVVVRRPRGTEPRSRLL